MSQRWTLMGHRFTTVYSHQLGSVDTKGLKLKPMGALARESRHNDDFLNRRQTFELRGCDDEWDFHLDHADG